MSVCQTPCQKISEVLASINLSVAVSPSGSNTECSPIQNLNYKYHNASPEGYRKATASLLVVPSGILKAGTSGTACAITHAGKAVCLRRLPEGIWSEVRMHAVTQPQVTPPMHESNFPVAATPFFGMLGVTRAPQETGSEQSSQCLQVRLTMTAN